MRHLQLMVKKHLIHVLHWDKGLARLVFESAPIQSHSYTVKGVEKTAFAAGQSYPRQDGIVGGGLSAFSRMTTRGKFDYDITKI